MSKPKSTSLYFSSGALLAASITGSAISFFRNMLVAKVVGPAIYGDFVLIMAVLAFAGFADFGLGTGVLYESPRLRSDGNFTSSDMMELNGFRASLVLGLTISLISCALTTLVSSVVYKQALVYFSALTILMPMINALIVVLRIRGQFFFLAILSLIGAAGGLVATYFLLTLEVLPPLHGALIGWVVGFVLMGLIGIKWFYSWFGFYINKGAVCNLVRVGFLPSLLPLISMGFLTLDRIAISGAASSSRLGYYGLGVIIGSAITLVSQSISTVLATRFSELGSSASRQVRELLERVLTALGCVMAILTGAMLFLMPPFIKLLFPEYYDGATEISFIAASFCFLFSVGPVGQSFVSTGKTMFFISIAGVMTAGKFLAVWSVGQAWGFHLGVTALCISNVIYGLACTWLGLRDNGAFLSWESWAKPVKMTGPILIFGFFGFAFVIGRGGFQLGLEYEVGCALVYILIGGFFIYRKLISPFKTLNRN